MFRNALISLVAAAALGAGMIAMTSAAEARYYHHHRHFSVGLGFYPFFGFGYPAYDYYGYPGYRYPSYYDDYYDGCRYRWVALRRWNPAHTHHVIIHRKRLVCY